MTGWVFSGVCLDGEPFALDGMDVWTCEWVRHEGEVAHVRDPNYGEAREFPVYTFRCDDRSLVVAAGEFSNCVWGFFRRDPSAG
jgi:hypothetical protein